MAKHPVCQRCLHYYVTHEPNMPYGCRAMRFKSALDPAKVVFSSSGIECELFTPKKTGQDGESISPKQLKRTA
jgi:hypothetical protein